MEGGIKQDKLQLMGNKEIWAALKGRQGFVGVERLGMLSRRIIL